MLVSLRKPHSSPSQPPPIATSTQQISFSGLRAGLAVLALCASGNVGATNGYFAHGYSVSQKALGGAGTALARDALIVTINPAGMALIDDGLAVGFSMFTPIREFTATERGDGASNGIMSISPGTRESHNEYFPLPAISYKRAIGDWGSWGVALYGNGGMNTEYTRHSALFGEGLVGFEAQCGGSFGSGQPTGSDNLGFCGNGTDRTGVDLAILFLSPSFAIKLGDYSAIGIAPLLAISRFAAQGLDAFAKFSNAPDKTSGNGHELAYGGGYRVGVQTRVLPGLHLAGSYQSRVWMDEFEDYAGLFGEQGDFDIPRSWNLGLALHLTDAHLIVADFQRIYYSEIRSVGNVFDPNAFVNNCAIPRLFGSSAESADCMGSSTGPGFGWQDMDIYKLGYEYSHGRYQYRVGYSQTKQPIPSDQVLFNVLAPGVVEKHYTAGVAMRWSENLTIETALMYAPTRPVRGKNPLSNTEANLLGLAGAGVGLGAVTGVIGQDTSGAFGPDENDQDLILNMKQIELSIGISWHY